MTHHLAAGLGALLGSRLSNTPLLSKALDAHQRVKAVNEFLFNKAQDIVDDICTPERFTRGRKVPTGCRGPSLTLDVNTGRCTLDLARERVECFPPSVVLTLKPAVCNLEYRERCVFKVRWEHALRWLAVSQLYSRSTMCYAGCFLRRVPSA